MNQKGIAYLMVLILGGIIVTASMVYYSSTIIESRVSTNSRMAKEIFYFTEGSIARAIYEIRKGNITIDHTNPNNFTKNYEDNSTASTPGSKLHSSVNFIPDPGNQTTIELRTYRFFDGLDFIDLPVSIKDFLDTNGNDLLDLNDLPNNLKIIIDKNNNGILDANEAKSYLDDYIEIYQDIKSVPYQINSTGKLIKNVKEVLPRTVSLKSKANFSRWVVYTNIPGTNTTSTFTPWDGFNYGISTGSSLAFSGSTVVRNGGVFSNVNINLGNAKNQLRITGGEAYSYGTITGVGKIVPRDGKQPKNIVPTTTTFPTINFSSYASIADRTLTGNQTFNSISSLPTIDPATKPPVDVIVVYIDGDLKITGNFINTQSLLLVVKGKVDMTGNATIGSPTIPFGIIAGGDINRSTGNAEVNGFYYSSGAIDMKGNFNLKGSLASAKGVTLTGNVDIRYDQALAYSLPLFDSSGSPDGGNTSTPGYQAINVLDWEFASFDYDKGWKQSIPTNVP